MLDQWTYGEVDLGNGVWVPTIFFTDKYGREWAVRLAHLDGD